MAAAFSSGAHAFPPHQMLCHKHLYPSGEFNVLPCSVWRIIYQQHEGELWPPETSAGVEEIQFFHVSSRYCVKTFTALSSLSEWSLPWAGRQTRCSAETPSSLHYSAGLCRDSVLAGCHRQELFCLLVSGWSMYVYPQLFLHEFSAGQSYEVLMFP